MTNKITNITLYKLCFYYFVYICIWIYSDRFCLFFGASNDF